jgi:hypothetical protein
MIGRYCTDGEHAHCGGWLKFVNADNVDDCVPCECSCHLLLSGPPVRWIVYNGPTFLGLRYSFEAAFRCAEEFRNRWDWHKMHISGGRREINP